MGVPRRGSLLGARGSGFVPREHWELDDPRQVFCTRQVADL